MLTGSDEALAKRRMAWFDENRRHSLVNVLTGDDPTFEGGVGNWTVNANCTITSDATWAHSGTKSLKLTPTALDPSAHIANTTNALPVVGGATYRLGAWATAKGGTSRNISLNVASFSAAHGFLGSGGSNTAGTMNVTEGVWTQAHVDVVVNATAAWAEIVLESSNMVSGGTEAAWFDDITFTKIA